MEIDTNKKINNEDEILPDSGYFTMSIMKSNVCSIGKFTDETTEFYAQASIGIDDALKPSSDINVINECTIKDLSLKMVLDK